MEKEYEVTRTIKVIDRVMAESKEKATEQLEYSGIDWKRVDIDWEVKEIDSK